MIKKAVSVLLGAVAAVGFCTAGPKGKEPAVDHIKIIPQTSFSDPYIAKNLGKFNLSFYTPYEESGKWGFQTSTGERSNHLATCAVDPNVIPLGSVIRITGNNGKVLEMRCIDTGGLIKGRWIDIFMDCSQKEGYAFMADFGEIHSVYLLEE